MQVSDVSTIEKIASSQYVWAILFIALLFGAYRFLQHHLKSLKDEGQQREVALIKLYEQQRVDSQGRETRLMTHLERTTETLESIQKNLSGLEDKLNVGLNDVWQHLDDRRRT